MHSSMNLLEPYYVWATFMVGLFSNVCCPRSSKSRIVPNVPGPTVSMVHLILWMLDLSRHFYVFQMPSYFRIYLCPSLLIFAWPHQDAIDVGDLWQFLQELSKSTMEWILIFNGPYCANRSPFYLHLCLPESCFYLSNVMKCSLSLLGSMTPLNPLCPLNTVSNFRQHV